MKIENDEFILREWTSTDVVEFMSLVNDGDIMRNLRPGFPDSAEKFLDFVRKANTVDGDCYLALELDGHVAGGISYAKKSQKNIELGNFWIGNLYRGLGLGRKISLALIEELFEKYPDHTTISTNQRAIEGAQNLGFKLRMDLAEMAKDRYGNFVKLLYFELFGRAEQRPFMIMPYDVETAGYDTQKVEPAIVSY